MVSYVFFVQVLTSEILLLSASPCKDDEVPLKIFWKNHCIKLDLCIVLSRYVIAYL